MARHSAPPATPRLQRWMQGKQRLLVINTPANMVNEKRPRLAWDRWLRSQGGDPLVVRCRGPDRREATAGRQPCGLGQLNAPPGRSAHAAAAGAGPDAGVPQTWGTFGPESTGWCARRWWTAPAWAG